VIDFNEAFDRVNGNVELLRKLARSFQESYAEEEKRLRSHIERQDSTAIEIAAHTLRGTVGVFSAGRAAKAARELENAAHKLDWPAVREAHERLHAEIELVLSELVGFCEEEPTCNS